MNAGSQLDAVRDALEETARRGRELAARLDDETWRRRPATGGWSAAECLAHLNLTTDAMAPLMGAAIDRARQSGQSPPARLKPDLLGRALAWFLEPPYRMRARTQPAFVAQADLPKASIMDAWDRGHRDLAALVEGARGVPIDGVKIVSPFDPRGLMKYSVYSAFLILAAHERRHLWQASRAVDAA
jgi:DinB superfamily